MGDQNVVNLLHALLDHSNPSNHSNALNTLNTTINQSNDSYNFFLTNFAHIATLSSAHNLTTRQSAIYLLKQHILSPPKIPSANFPTPATLTPQTTSTLQSHLLGLLSDPDTNIRNAASSTISAAVACSTISLPAISTCLITCWTQSTISFPHLSNKTKSVYKQQNFITGKLTFPW